MNTASVQRMDGGRIIATVFLCTFYLIFSKCFNVRVNNLVWAVIMHFRISSASRVYFGSFEGRYQCGYYCRERLYSQISLKVRDSKKKLAFSSRLPLRHHIA